MAQTSVSFNPAAATPGLVFSSDSALRTGKNNEVSAAMPFGIAVVLDTAASADLPGTKLPTAGTDKFAGIVAFQYTAPEFFDAAATGIAPSYLFPLLEEGACWVTVENAVTKGARPFVRITAHGGLTQLGAFRSNADTVSSVDTAVELKGGEYLTGTSGAGIALVKFSAAANRATQS